MTGFRQVSALTIAAVAAAFGLSGSEAQAQTTTQPQRFGTHYQQSAQISCEAVSATPCIVPFSTLTRAPLKVLKASCTLRTSEGGSPSKEITGAVLGRLSDNQRNFFPGQYLAPMQTEFTQTRDVDGTPQIVLNFLIDTLWVVPANWRPAILISRINAPAVEATCSVAGEELVTG